MPIYFKPKTIKKEKNLNAKKTYEKEEYYNKKSFDDIIPSHFKLSCLRVITTHV